MGQAKTPVKTNTRIQFFVLRLMFAALLNGYRRSVKISTNAGVKLNAHGQPLLVLVAAARVVTAPIVDRRGWARCHPAAKYPK